MFGGTPRLSQLRKELREKLRYDSNKYSLFTMNGNNFKRIRDHDDSFIKPQDKFALKTHDGHFFYAQAVTTENISNTQHQLIQSQRRLAAQINKQVAESIQSNADREREIQLLKANREREIATLEQSTRIQYQKLEQLTKETLSKYNEKMVDMNKNNIHLIYNDIKSRKMTFDEKKGILMQQYVKYEKLYTKLKKEYDRLQKLHFEEIKDPNIKQLVLLGITGDGKSTFGNRLCGDTSKKAKTGPFKKSFSAKSETTTIQKFFLNTSGSRIAVVDTPGCFDSERADYQNAVNLIEWLKGCGGINLFIIVFRPPRLNDKFQDMLENLSDMLGKGFWEHVIFVVTHLKINMKNKHKDGIIIDTNEGKDDSSDYSDDELSPEDYLIDFRAKIKSTLKLNAKPTVIGVENMNRNSYTVAVQEIIRRCKQNKKFEPKRLKSPFDVDKVKMKKMYDKMKSQIAFINQIKETMFSCENIIIKQIKDIQKHNPQYKAPFDALNVFKMTQMQKINFHNVSIFDVNEQYLEYEDEKEMEELSNYYQVNKPNNDQPNKVKKTLNIKSTKGIEDDPNKSWNCPFCTFENDANNSICVMCYQGDKPMLKEEILKQTFTILHSKSTKWVLDADRDECVNCGQQFSMWKWKYHCLACGDIFCWKCRQSVVCKPNPILMSNTATKEKQVEVCSHCAKKYKYFTYNSGSVM